MPVVVLQLLFPAAAGTVGALLRRTAANGAITDAFPGNGMGDGSVAHGKGRQRTHDDQCIDRGEEQGYV